MIMTKIERKRAKLLEDTMQTFIGTLAKTGNSVILCAVLILIFDAVLFPMLLDDNEIYVIVSVHIALFQIFSAMFVFLPTMQIGDRSIIKDMGNRNFGGSYYQGKFITAMPFESKDLMNLRLINCEKQLFTSTLAAAVLMAAVFIAGKLGYHDYRGIVGMLALFVPVQGIVMISVNLFCNRWYPGMILTMCMAMTPIFAIIGCADEDGETSVELALQFNEKLKGFEFMSGISGIIILAAISAAIAIGAEMLVKNMKKRSWQLK